MNKTTTFLSVMVAAIVSANAASEVISITRPPSSGGAGASSTGTNTVVTASQPVRDYSRGFAEFMKMGLPDVSKAEYVKVTVYESGSYPSKDAMGSLYEIRLAGNGWMIEETPKVKGRFVVGHCRIIEAWDQAVEMKARQKKLQEAVKKAQEAARTNKNAMALVANPGMIAAAIDEETGSGGKKTLAQWKKVDLKKDVEKVLAFLGKNEKQGEGMIRRRSYDRLAYNSGYGILMLNAIQYHQKGFTNEANQIVGKLFERAGDQRKVVSQAIGRIADVKYSDTFAKFTAGGSWSDYGKDIEELIGRFGGSWGTAPAAKKLLEKVKQRATSASAPAISGDGLADEDRKLAAELADKVPHSGVFGYGGRHGFLWILPQSKAVIARMPVHSRTNVVDRIKDRGMKSVPLLMAMLKDDCLARVSLAEVSGSEYYEFHDPFGDMAGAMDSESREKMVEKMYRSMKRPASRSEIASAMLKPLLLKKNRHGGEEEEESVDDLLARCKTWYDANKSKTPAELAYAYLKGDDTQQQQAMEYLLRAGTDADTEAVEKYLLDTANSHMSIYQVGRYVEKRGEKAKAFLEKYEAKILAATKDAATDPALFKKGGRMDDNAKERIAQLKEMFSSQSLKDLVAEIVAGKKTLDESGQALHRKMMREKPETALGVLLDASVESKDAAIATGMLQMSVGLLRRPGYGESDIDDDDSEAAVGERKNALNPTTHAAQWRKLLADTRKTEGSLAYVAPTIAELAAKMIETLYGSPEDAPPTFGYGGYYRAMNVAPSLGRRTLAIYRKRAEALLSGGEKSSLPSFPKSDDVTDERKKSVTARIMQADAVSVMKTVFAFDDVDFLALIGVADKDKKLQAKLAPCANTVRNVIDDTGSGTARKEFEGAKDKQIDRATIEKALGVCMAQVGQGKIARCTITRRKSLDGVDIEFAEIAPGSKEFNALAEARKIGETLGPDVSASVYNGGVKDASGTAVWPVGPGRTAPQSVVSTVEDKIIDAVLGELDREAKQRAVDDQKAFWKIVDDFCAGKGNVCRSGMVSFFGRPVVKVPPKKADSKPSGATGTAEFLRPLGHGIDL